MGISALLARNEYLATENRILKAQLNGRPKLSDGERGALGERSLRRALSEYADHFHAERNHQRKGNVLLFPLATDRHREGPVRCRERFGGLLRYYHREAA